MEIGSALSSASLLPRRVPGVSDCLRDDAKLLVRYVVERSTVDAVDTTKGARLRADDRHRHWLRARNPEQLGFSGADGGSHWCQSACCGLQGTPPKKRLPLRSLPAWSLVFAKAAISFCLYKNANPELTTARVNNS